MKTKLLPQLVIFVSLSLKTFAIPSETGIIEAPSSNQSISIPEDAARRLCSARQDIAYNRLIGTFRNIFIIFNALDRNSVQNILNTCVEIFSVKDSGTLFTISEFASFLTSNVSQNNISLVNTLIDVAKKNDVMKLIQLVDQEAFTQHHVHIDYQTIFKCISIATTESKSIIFLAAALSTFIDRIGDLTGPTGEFIHFVLNIMTIPDDTLNHDSDQDVQILCRLLYSNTLIIELDGYIE